MHSRLHSQKGSLLIVCLLLCSIIGISIASYLQLARTSITISNRALYNNGAMNLAENGLEEAMYSINKAVDDTTYTWSDWHNDGINAWRQFPSTGTYTFDGGGTGIVQVIAYNYTGVSSPKFVARATVTLGGYTSKTIEKWVMVQIRKTSKFSNGLVAKNTITFNGNNASVDSWNSEKNPDGTTRASPVPYNTSYRNDNGSVGSISVGVGSVSVNQADVWGYVGTGGAAPSVGNNGSIMGANTPAGVTVDPNRVSTDFSASFDPVSTPTGGSSLASLGNNDLPTTIGTAGTTNVYTISSISSSGNNTKVLTIQGDVTLIVSSSISMTGNSSIYIAPGSSLKIYTAGTVDITGNGVANGGTTQATQGQAKNFQVWGTSTTSQNISIKGNGAFSGVVYAPTANVTIAGNGDVSGSVVANNITLTGNAAFHYDESLSDFGGGNPYRVSLWEELTTEAQRNTYASAFTSHTF
ncbi:MAG TPA: hypothetical protein VL200_12190 [Lacunisphaera sp.]|jgi:hypothetical protein|nr:hypothetical protein [Lacunisphaera sp.]